MAEGKLRPNHKGHYIVHNKQEGDGVKEPKIEWVTPLAQAVELAKSELKTSKRKRMESKPYARENKSRIYDYEMRPPGIPKHFKE